MKTVFCNVPNCVFYREGSCQAVKLRGEIADRIVTTSGGTIAGCSAYIHVNSVLEHASTLSRIPSSHTCCVYAGVDDLPYAICGRVRVDWEALGEGLRGDYDPEDPSDIELLRFTAYLATEDGWEQIDDASYCTNVPVGADPDALGRMICVIARKYGNMLNSDPEQSVKKLGERLSWISLEDYL